MAGEVCHLLSPYICCFGIIIYIYYNANEYVILFRLLKTKNVSTTEKLRNLFNLYCCFLDLVIFKNRREIKEVNFLFSSSGELTLRGLKVELPQTS